MKPIRASGEIAVKPSRAVPRPQLAFVGGSVAAAVLTVLAECCGGALEYALLASEVLIIALWATLGRPALEIAVPSVATVTIAFGRAGGTPEPALFQPTLLAAGVGWRMPARARSPASGCCSSRRLSAISGRAPTGAGGAGRRARSADGSCGSAPAGSIDSAPIPREASESSRRYPTEGAARKPAGFRATMKDRSQRKAAKRHGGFPLLLEGAPPHRQRITPSRRPASSARARRSRPSAARASRCRASPWARRAGRTSTAGPAPR